jgi:hypothetical protein
MRTNRANLPYNRSPDYGGSQEQRRIKMHKTIRQIEDPATSVLTLLISAALGFSGLLVLTLMLALGF